MVRSGIRFRKPHHHLPKVEGELSPGDVDRLFGRFRWGAYTPAGTLERNGFFWRQLARARRDPDQPRRARRAAAAARWCVMALLAIVGAATLFVVLDHL